MLDPVDRGSARLPEQIPIEDKPEPKPEPVREQTKPATPTHVAPKDEVERTGAAEGPNAARWAHPGDGIDGGPAAAEEAAGAAQHVLDTGTRFLRKDDYEARTVALAQELEKGDAGYRRQVMQEILARDPKAMDSWLQPARANAMEREGRITSAQKGLMAEGLASAYNSGLIPEEELPVGMTPKTGEEGKVKASALDHMLDPYQSSGGPAGEQQTVESAQRVREFLDFANSSSGPEAVQFRERYADHLLKEYVVDDAVGYHRPEQRDAAAGLAANLLASNPPDSAVRTLARHKDDIPGIMSAAARSDGLYGDDMVGPRAKAIGRDPAAASVPDGAERLLDRVALAQSKAPEGPFSNRMEAEEAGAARALSKDIDDVSLALAKLPASEPRIFEGEAGEGRAAALTKVVSKNSEVVLEAMTSYDNHTKGGTPEFVGTARELGSLMKVTMFDPDNPNSAAFEDKVTEYAGKLSTAINTTSPEAPEYETNIQRLGMLTGGLDESIGQRMKELEEDHAKKTAVLGFVVDTAASLLPAGKLVDGAVAGITSPILKDVAKDLATQGTDALTEEAKQALVDKLGGKAGEAFGAEEARNTLADVFKLGLEKGNARVDLENTSLNIRQELADHPG
jgi:hypothetical protein